MYYVIETHEHHLTRLKHSNDCVITSTIRFFEKLEFAVQWASRGLREQTECPGDAIAAYNGVQPYEFGMHIYRSTIFKYTPGMCVTMPSLLISYDK